MITVNLSPLAITPLARREACLAGEDLIEEAARGETTGVRTADITPHAMPADEADAVLEHNFFG